MLGRQPSILVERSTDWTDEYGRSHPGGRVLKAEATIPASATIEGVRQAVRAVGLALAPGRCSESVVARVGRALYDLRVGCAKRPGAVADEQGQADAYLDVLLGYPPDVALQAIANLRGAVQFFPTELELRRELDSLMASRTALHRALLAWCPAKAEGERLAKIRHAYRFWSGIVADGEAGREIRVSIGNGRNAEIVRTLERARELRDRAAALGGADAEPDRGDLPAARQLVAELKAQEEAIAKEHRARLKPLSDRPGSASSRAREAAIARRERRLAEREGEQADPEKYNSENNSPEPGGEAQVGKFDGAAA